MKTKSTALTKEERDILILAALHPNGEYLDNCDIAQRLGLSVSRVKTLMHKACIKLKAQSRYEAIFFAVTRGEVTLSDLFSLDELAEVLSSLSPDMLRKIAGFVRQEMGHGHLMQKDEQIICTDRKQNTTLTKSERDVLILISYGLTNEEIADRLCISLGAVRTFIYRACIKLGARKRADAVLLALKQREIDTDELFSLNELIRYLAPLGAESIEKMAGLLSQKRGHEPIPSMFSATSLLKPIGTWLSCTWLSAEAVFSSPRAVSSTNVLETPN